MVDSPEWIRLCAAKSPCWANDRLHVSQAYGFSPVCVRWWICSKNTREKLRPHRVHWCGFSPVCVLIIESNSNSLNNSRNLCKFSEGNIIYLIWTLRLLLSTKPRLHTSHWYGLRPLCRLACKSSAPWVLNAFGHIWHWNGRSPVCIFRFYAEKRIEFMLKLSWIERNTGKLTLVCVTSSDCVGNARSQYWHLWFFW